MKRLHLLLLILFCLIAFIYSLSTIRIYPPTLTSRIDASLTRATGTLLRYQSPNGEFHSDTYGALKNNITLTPHVLFTLQQLPPSLQTPAVTAARQKSAARLAEFAQNPPTPIPYAVYTLANALRCLAHEPQHTASIPPLIAMLRQHQLTEDRGWSSADLAYGGWGYSDFIPDKPAAGNEPLVPIDANLSSTLYALEALRAAGVPATDPAIQKALMFVRRCQNNSPPADPRLASPFDDGGFFFSLDSVLRNKAASAGTDSTGTRYRSYGSMTCDGLRALVLCGLPTDDPACEAAALWLRDRFAVDHQPGDFPADRRLFQLGMYYYYLASLAQIPEASADALPAHWSRQLATELLSRQNPDGSWLNSYTDAKEDEPLVATSEAALALSLARRRLSQTP